MRRITILLATTCLFAVGAFGCSKSDGEKAADCAAALTERTGGDFADKPTVSEAEQRVDALDKTLADMVRMGYEGVAKDASDTLEKKTQEDGEGRPEACEELSDDDYTVLLIAKAIDGLGWTDKDGQFDKLNMVENLGD
ncbi:hypothetical protein OHA09_36085 [Streptomyces longwoodensis]|uniref:hypothetical protein n=1 Tax=Streptomyces longwoodensis TaxID=68231 RepID=UPI002E814228|nr:hypothetical protein [Streptomyces longwoodensis]WUC55746.1 hypothetical protein OHA09_00890 [Streptomyces longwoodensis]WUC62135.1 hypothetical protein OHA09_36085 [Streptomyces longwoodensis]